MLNFMWDIHFARGLVLAGVASLGLTACGGSGGGANNAGVDSPDFRESLSCIKSHPFVTRFDSLIDEQERYTYSSFDGDEPPLSPNLYRDARSASGLPKPAGVAATHCEQADRFRVGVARSDITAPWAGRSRAGYEAPVNVLTGLSQRVYARAFVIGDTCSGANVVLVNADLGFMHRSVRDAVLERLAGDPATAEIDPRGILLSATHTHNFSGGYSYDMMYTGLHLGHKPDVLEGVVEGISDAIRSAWLEYQQAEPGKLTLAMNELLHTSANRHPSGYRQNSEAERAEYLDVNGEDQLVNRLVTQLNLFGKDSKIKGLLNWFSVHPTASLDGTLAGGDSKGYAAYMLEKSINGLEPRSDHTAPFVAGFLQSDEGDVVPIRYLDNTIEGEPRLPPLITSALGQEINTQLANVAISGTRQVANAVDLIEGKQLPVRGSVDYRMRYVDFSDQRVTDEVVLASMSHPPELDSDVKRTCDPLYGMSSVGKEAFGKYQTCEGVINIPLEEFFADLSTGNIQRSVGDVAKVALCALGDVDLSAAEGPDYSCQAEKGYFLGLGDKGPISTPVSLPLQLLRIGNFAVISLPWEITTMAGRRIREMVLTELKEIGVDYVVIAGLANEYVGYLTTREEYARQGYEASSNQFGPWTLVVVLQELRALSLAMVNDEAPYPVEASNPGSPVLPNLVGVDPLLVDLPLRGAFGTPIDDVQESYAAGEYVRFSYQAAHPNNNTYMSGHYFEIERQVEDGSWQLWLTDEDPETVLTWQSSSQDQYFPAIDSVLEVDWFVGHNTPPGLYRIVYRTAARTMPLIGAVTEHEAVSRSFQVQNNNPSCAWE